MLDKLHAVANRYEELCAKSEQPDFYNDPKQAAKLLREKNDLEQLVETFHSYNAALREMEEALELMEFEGAVELRERLRERLGGSAAAGEERVPTAKSDTLEGKMAKAQRPAGQS